MGGVMMGGRHRGGCNLGGIQLGGVLMGGKDYRCKQWVPVSQARVAKGKSRYPGSRLEAWNNFLSSWMQQNGYPGSYRKQAMSEASPEWQAMSEAEKDSWAGVAPVRGPASGKRKVGRR
jgi:hypothetical protein